MKLFDSPIGDRPPASARLPDGAPEHARVLEESEEGRRALALGELHAAFAALGVRCVLARRHRIVLRFDVSQWAPSGPVDPELHIFAAGRKEVATTDGTLFSLAGGGRYPAGDPAAAAAAVLVACWERR